MAAAACDAHASPLLHAYLHRHTPTACSPTFKVFTSMDVVGVEVAGALK